MALKFPSVTGRKEEMTHSASYQIALGVLGQLYTISPSPWQTRTTKHGQCCGQCCWQSKCCHQTWSSTGANIPPSALHIVSTHTSIWFLSGLSSQWTLYSVKPQGWYWRQIQDTLQHKWVSLDIHMHFLLTWSVILLLYGIFVNIRNSPQLEGKNYGTNSIS